MNIFTNYKDDLVKSKATPILIEISKNDLDSLGGINSVVHEAEEIYNRDSNNKNLNKNYTNIIHIEANDCNQKEKVCIFQAIIDLLSDDIKQIKKLELLKEPLNMGLSYMTGGVIDDLDYGIVDDFIDPIINLLTDESHEKVSEYIITETEEIHNFSIDKKTIYLSRKSKKDLQIITSQLNKNLSSAESFHLLIKLLNTTTIDMPKIMLIENPHKLDEASLALLVLFLSIGKNTKDQDKHTGMSFLYIYSDVYFQPLKDVVSKKYSTSKKLLDEQRLFAQRYSMLEHPTTDIPTVAVKSSMFVGRDRELKILKDNYFKYQKNSNLVLFEIIKGEAGVGKTKLVKKHLQDIRRKEGNKQIQLTILNQSGHNSTNSGLTSLLRSIDKEIVRLKKIEQFHKKHVKNLFVYIKNYFLNLVTDLVAGELFVKIWKLTSHDKDMTEIKDNINHKINLKCEDEKNELFHKIDKNLNTLISLSHCTIPIIIFIDDVQWIDNDSSEYIITHLMKNFKIYIISTVRKSDSEAIFEILNNDKSANKFTLKILDMLKNPKKDSIELKSNIIELSGIDNKTLTALISKVIRGDDKYKKMLADTIMNKLNNNESFTEVNTLFATETINMLCDENFYTEEVKDRLIINQPHMMFNEKLESFQFSLENTFDILNKKYKSSLDFYNNSSNVQEQKFNLVAYSILQERLNHIKLHLKEFGDTAINTLLLSSILGIPFSSNIIQNIFNKISIDNDVNLLPLKDYFLENTNKVHLDKKHYNIIEHTYELIDRYIAINFSYVYRHSLLHIFLENHLDFKLKEIFINNFDLSINKFYTLILDEINAEEKRYFTNNMSQANLSASDYEYKIFFMNTKLTLLSKASHTISSQWTIMHIQTLIEIADIYAINNKVLNSIKNYKDAQALIETQDYVNQKDIYKFYVSCSIGLASLYDNMGAPTEAITLKENCKNNLTKYYLKNNDEWQEIYINFLINLAISYNDNEDNDKALKVELEALNILEKLYTLNHEQWIYKYGLILINISYTYKSLDKIDEAIKYENKAYTLTKNKYSENEALLHIYLKSMMNLALSYKNIWNLNSALTLEEEVENITKNLYEKNSYRWSDIYTRCLTSIGITLSKMCKYKMAYQYELKSIEIREKLYLEAPSRWIDAYTLSLNNIAISDSYLKTNMCKDKFDKVLKLRSKYYDEEPKRWRENYISSLLNVSLIDAFESNYSQAEDKQKIALTLTENEYNNKNNNKHKWSYLYSKNLILLAYTYSSLSKFQEAYDLETKAVTIRKKLYQNSEDNWTDRYLLSLVQLTMSAYILDNKEMTHIYYNDIIIVKKNIQKKDLLFWYHEYITPFINLDILENKIEYSKLIELKSYYVEHELFTKQSPYRWSDAYK